MIRKIITNPEFLKQQSVEANIETIKQDSPIIKDLMRIAGENKDSCLCLTGNQIGYYERAMVIKTNAGSYAAIVNPTIIAKVGGRKKSREICLSHPGKRILTKRYKEIVVTYHVFDDDGALIGLKSKFKGLPAITIQHAIDHFGGKII
ncbi:peptide deformylase [Candidatus Pacearchaeota archaeon]|nr:peptide deformylase [Candidatus Pacearchaeota archaeon]